MNWKQLWSEFIDLLFPRCCEACNRPLVGSEELICTLCRVDLPRMETDSQLFLLISNKFPDNPAIAGVHTFLVFTKRGKVRNLLHSLKYRGKEELGVMLGKMFGNELLMSGSLPEVDLLVSVPLHPRKKRERGYNQSDALARGFAESTGIPFSDTVLERTKYTSSQTGKTKSERQKNVQGVFKVTDQTLIEGKKIALFDDVLTTGATLEACVAALERSGCNGCYIMTLAAAQN